MKLVYDAIVDVAIVYLTIVYLTCISHKPAADVAQALLPALLPAASRLPGFGPVPGVSAPVRRADTVSERSAGTSACATSLHPNTCEKCGLTMVLQSILLGFLLLRGNFRRYPLLLAHSVMVLAATGAVRLPFVLFRGPLFGVRKRDRLLLAVSAGLGISVTGAATYVVSLPIRCWAFRPAVVSA
jgi:hypothetical protein